LSAAWQLQLQHQQTMTRPSEGWLVGGAGGAGGPGCTSRFYLIAHSHKMHSAFRTPRSPTTQHPTTSPHPTLCTQYSGFTSVGRQIQSSPAIASVDMSAHTLWSSTAEISRRTYTENNSQEQPIILHYWVSTWRRQDEC